MKSLENNFMSGVFCDVLNDFCCLMFLHRTFPFYLLNSWGLARHAVEAMENMRRALTVDVGAIRIRKTQHLSLMVPVRCLVVSLCVTRPVTQDSLMGADDCTVLGVFLCVHVCVSEGRGREGEGEEEGKPVMGQRRGKKYCLNVDI